MPDYNRRSFMKRVGLAAGYAATPFGYAANETIAVGCIGTGGRCRELMGALNRIPGVRITAVADVWDGALAKGRKLADPKAFVTKDYTELLRRSDVDAVVIGAPDHWHAPMTIDACAAGKDVYVEKPLTHDLSEGPMVIDARDRYKRIVQVGMQQRSMPHLQKACEIVKSGQLGKIHKVHMTWNRNTPSRGRQSYNIEPASVDWKRFLGNAPDQPFNEYRLRNWRWFWDFGGGTLTDLMVHWMDVVNWYLDLDVPASATSMGDNFHAQGLWETPDTMQTLLHYPDKEVQAYFEGTFVNAHPGAMTEFMGTEATLYIDRGRYEVHPERKRNSIGELMENPLRPSELILGSGPRGQDFYDRPNGEILHLSNWLECIRTRQRPNAPVEAGVKAAAAAHLGNIAYRKGEVERLNSELRDMPSAATTSPPCAAQPFELPGQHLAAGLFDLREMDLHLHAGLERQVPLNAWIDLAVADGRKVLVLLDHLELYRKTPQQYEAWRSGRDFQADYPLGPAGHKALFADFDAAAKRQDVIVFKGWEISEDELDGRLEAAPMRMAEVIGWHISPRNGAEPPNGRTLIHRVKQIGEVQKQYPVPMMLFHPFPMRIENIRNTAQARGRDLRTITPEEYRFFQPGEQEELIKLLSGSSIYIEISHATEPCFKDPACREALIADTLPLAKAGVQFSISTDNHYMGHLKKPFNPAYYCAPMGITPFNSNTIVRELLALKAKREMLAAQEHGSPR